MLWTNIDDGFLVSSLNLYCYCCSFAGIIFGEILRDLLIFVKISWNFEENIIQLRFLSELLNENTVWLNVIFSPMIF